PPGAPHPPPPSWPLPRPLAGPTVPAGTLAAPAPGRRACSRWRAYCRPGRPRPWWLPLPRTQGRADLGANRWTPRCHAGAWQKARWPRRAGLGREDLPPRPGDAGAWPARTPGGSEGASGAPLRSVVGRPVVLPARHRRRDGPALLPRTAPEWERR